LLRQRISVRPVVALQVPSVRIELTKFTDEPHGGFNILTIGRR